MPLLLIIIHLPTNPHLQGHDTTTSAICFILFNLAKYPAVQQKVVDEIRSVVNDDFNEPITLA